MGKERIFVVSIACFDLLLFIYHNRIATHLNMTLGGTIVVYIQ